MPHHLHVRSTPRHRGGRRSTATLIVTLATLAALVSIRPATLLGRQPPSAPESAAAVMGGDAGVQQAITID